MLIVSQSGGGQFCLKVNGEYKRTGKAAALPLPGGAAAHDREKEYLLREGENIPAFVDLGVFTQDFKIVRAKYSKYRQINRFVELVDQSFAAGGREEISILDFGCEVVPDFYSLLLLFRQKRCAHPHHRLRSQGRRCRALQ